MELSTHAGQLERWLGKETVEELSKSMENWYGPPVAIAGVPGKVFAHRGGDFRGRIASGLASTALCMSEDFLKKFPRAAQRWARKQASQANMAGFASLSDLIAEATAGKRVHMQFQKAGSTGVAAVTNSLWGLGAQPAAGANAANAPGGEAPTSATTGAHPYANPTGGDTLHFVGGQVTASAVNTLLLYDRIFQVNKTMNSTATEAVSGVPTRYQNTTAGSADSAEGNFLFVEVGGTALAATAHNWTTCLYTDQAGSTGITLPSLTGNSGAIVRRLDHPVGQWFAPLATGDTGIKNLTQMQCSAAVATGVVNFVIGHPIAWMPAPIANIACLVDGINTAFNLVRVFDNAALAFLEVTKPATTATNYNVQLDFVYG